MEKNNTFNRIINQTEVGNPTTLKISKVLARNIKLVREDDEFLNLEKAAIADALCGISLAKANLENEDYILDKLETAENIITSYLFYLDIFKKDE